MDLWAHAMHASLLNNEYYASPVINSNLIIIYLFFVSHWSFNNYIHDVVWCYSTSLSSTSAAASYIAILYDVLDIQHGHGSITGPCSDILTSESLIIVSKYNVPSAQHVVCYHDNHVLVTAVSCGSPSCQVMPLYICTWTASWQGINLLLLLFCSSHASLDTCSVTQMDLNWVIIHLIECRGAESCSASALQEEEVTNEELQYGAPSLTSELWAQIHVHLLYLVILYLLFINGTKTVLY